MCVCGRHGLSSERAKVVHDHVCRGATCHREICLLSHVAEKCRSRCRSSSSRRGIAVRNTAAHKLTRAGRGACVCDETQHCCGERDAVTTATWSAPKAPSHLGGKHVNKRLGRCFWPDHVRAHHQPRIARRKYMQPKVWSRLDACVIRWVVYWSNNTNTPI